MLFCDFYKKLQKALGDTEFKKLPPDKGNIYQKIFMLMTLSCNHKSSGNYGKDLELLKDKFVELKEDLEKLTNNLKELKKEAKILVKGEESFVMDEKSLVHLLNHIYRNFNLKDRIIIYCYIKNIESLFSCKISDRSFTKHNEIFSVIPDLRENIENFTKYIPLKKLKDKFISSFKEIPDKNLKDKLISSFKEIPDENLSNSNLNEDILNLIRNIKDHIRDKDGFDESCLSRIFNKDVFNKACFNNLNIKFLNCIRDIKAGLRDILNEDEGIDTFKDRFNKTRFNNDLFYNLNNMSRLKTKEFRYQIIARFKSYKDEYAAEASLIEILKKESLNVVDYKGIVDIFTDNFTDILINHYINILTDSLIDSFNKCQTVIDSLLEVIPKESFKVTIDFKDVKDVKDNDSHIYDFIDSRMDNFIVSIIDNLIDNLNKDIDNLNKDIDSFNEDIDNLNKDINNFNKYNYDIPRYSKYLGVYLKDVFPDNSDVSDRLIKEYERYLNFWRKYDVPSKYSTFKKYCHGKDSISKFADEITPNLVNHPYFINVINNLPNEQKGKIYKELKADISSLDFLGEKLSALLKKIIVEATNNRDLKILEKLWEKEEDNFLEMVLYPILYDLFNPNSATPYPRYYFYLKIQNEKNEEIIEKHPDTFLDNLFSLLLKEEDFFDDFKLENIQHDRVHIGGVIPKWTTADVIYGDGYNHDMEMPLGCFPLLLDLINFLGKENTFTDIKHILEFKKTLKNNELYDYDNSFVLIKLNPFLENPLYDYYKKNKEKIDRYLVFENLEKYKEQESFWEEKRTSKLYKYIQEILKAEEARSHTSFQRLRDYYLQGKCPAILRHLSYYAMHQFIEN